MVKKKRGFSSVALDISSFLMHFTYMHFTLNKVICQHLLGQNFSQKVPFFLQDKYLSSDNCPLYMIPSMTYSKSYAKRSKKQKSNNFKWKAESDILRQRAFNDDDLHAMTAKLLSLICVFSKQFDNGEYRFFEGLTRGGTRYNKRTESMIRDILDVFSSGEREVIALTITYDVKRFGENRFLAWANYTNHIHSSLEYFRKHLDASYCWVKESTKNGYPHAHIVVTFPKGTIANYDAYKNQESLKSTYIGRLFSDTLKSPVWDMQKISGNRIKYYLSKYVSKGTTTDLKKLSNPDYVYNDAERKMLTALFSLIVTRTRQWGKSTLKHIVRDFPNANPIAIQNLSSSKKYDENIIARQKQIDMQKYIMNSNPDIIAQFQKYGKSSYKLVEDIPEDMKNDLRQMTDDLKVILSGEDNIDSVHYSRFRAVLIKLCNNSPTPCDKHLFMMKKERLKQVFNKDIDEINANNSDEIKKFKNNSRVLGCEGCFAADINAIIHGSTEGRYQFIIGREKGKPIYLFTPEIFNDDVAFVQNLLMFWSYVQKRIFIDHKLYRDVIEELQGEK